LLNYCEALGEKVDSIARYIHAQEAVNIARTEAERFSPRKATAENAVVRLKCLLPNPLDETPLAHDFAAQEQPRLAAGFGSNKASGRALPSVSLHERSRVSDAVQHLPEQHPVRARFGNPDAVKREPDNARIREATGARIALEGAELKRGSTSGSHRFPPAAVA
jgi:hypothetical protein